MNSPAQKAIVIGFDGASMELVLRMAREGHAPNIARLLDRGAYRKMLGVYPTLTPPGWTTLATGAWAGTHKVTDFNIHKPGNTIGESVWGINTHLCQCEFLWDAAERSGKKPILVKYEISWPPTIKQGIQVEGTGPGVSNHAQIAGYHLFVTERYRGYRIGGQRDAEHVDPSALQDADTIDLIDVVPAEGWKNAPPSTKPPLEATLRMRPLCRQAPQMKVAREGTPKDYYALIYASGEAGYDRLLVAPDKDGAHAYTDLGVKDWSHWWQDDFVIDGKPTEGSVRCKLMVLSPDGRHVELFFPQIWPTGGSYTFPEGIGREVFENVGPFLQNPARDAMGLIDDDTYFEVLDYHLEVLADTAIYLMETYGWDLLFTETHASDYANHFFLGQADPICGAPPEVVERAYSGVVRTYEAMDHWVGHLTEKMDDDTVLVIVSDHGGTPSRYRNVLVEEVLEGAELLAYTVENGAKVIDWSKTRAAPGGLGNVFVNLKGREPEGIVDPADLANVQREIIDAIYAYKDPVTGERPFTLALTHDDAEMLNLWSDQVGDVVYAKRAEFDGAHGYHLPTSRLGIGAQHAVFIMAGAGVRQGVHLKGHVRQVDVAPTISYLLGIATPRNAEGGIVYEALVDPDWHLAEIKRLSGQA